MLDSSAHATFIPGDPGRASCLALWPSGWSHDRADLLVPTPSGIARVDTQVDLVPLGEALDDLVVFGLDANTTPSLRAWGLVARDALASVAAGRLRPAVSAQGFDEWEIGPLTDADRRRRRRLAEWLPPAAYCRPISRGRRFHDDDRRRGHRGILRRGVRRPRPNGVGSNDRAEPAVVGTQLDRRRRRSPTSPGEGTRERRDRRSAVAIRRRRDLHRRCPGALRGRSDDHRHRGGALGAFGPRIRPGRRERPSRHPSSRCPSVATPGEHPRDRPPRFLPPRGRGRVRAVR